MVRLRVPTTTNGTLKRFFAGVGSNVDDQTFLVSKRFPAGGTDVWPVTTVGAAVLGQHSFGQEVRTTLADKRTIPSMLADVLSQLDFLTKRAVARVA